MTSRTRILWIVVISLLIAYSVSFLIEYLRQKNVLKGLGGSMTNLSSNNVPPATSVPPPTTAPPAAASSSSFTAQQPVSSPPPSTTSTNGSSSSTLTSSSSPSSTTTTTPRNIVVTNSNTTESGITSPYGAPFGGFGAVPTFGGYGAVANVGGFGATFGAIPGGLGATFGAIPGGLGVPVVSSVGVGAVSNVSSGAGSSSTTQTPTIYNAVGNTYSPVGEVPTASEALLNPNSLFPAMTDCKNVGLTADICTVVACLRRRGHYLDVQQTPYGQTEFVILNQALCSLWSRVTGTNTFIIRNFPGVHGRWRIFFDRRLGTWNLENIDTNFSDRGNDNDGVTNVATTTTTTTTKGVSTEDVLSNFRMASSPPFPQGQQQQSRARLQKTTFLPVQPRMRPDARV